MVFKCFECSGSVKVGPSIQRSRFFSKLDYLELPTSRFARTVTPPALDDEEFALSGSHVRVSAVKASKAIQGFGNADDNRIDEFHCETRNCLNGPSELN